MKLNITLISNINGVNTYYSVKEPIHKSLIGNMDYNHSNIILNADTTGSEPTYNLQVAVDQCYDKEALRDRLKNAIDIFIDNSHD